jgi:endosialidase-like protein
MSGTRFSAPGTLALQNANAVAITGGSAADLTSLRVGVAAAIDLEVATIRFTSASNYGLMFDDTLVGGTGTAIYFRRNGAQRGSITVSDTATTYNTSSDRRLKDNIRPAPEAGDKIDAIEVVSHDWRDGGDSVAFGLIAQDLYAIAPLAVKPGDDGPEVVEQWQVDHSKLVPMLIREVQSLRARVAAIETA